MAARYLVTPPTLDEITRAALGALGPGEAGWLVGGCLRDELLAVREHHRPRVQPPDDLGEQDRLAASGRQNDQHRRELPPRRQHSLGRRVLIRPKLHAHRLSVSRSSVFSSRMAA